MRVLSCFTLICTLYIHNTNANASNKKDIFQDILVYFSNPFNSLKEDVLNLLSGYKKETREPKFTPSSQVNPEYDPVSFEDIGDASTYSTPYSAKFQHKPNPYRVIPPPLKISQLKSKPYFIDHGSQIKPLESMKYPSPNTQKHNAMNPVPQVGSESYLTAEIRPKPYFRDNLSQTRPPSYSKDSSLTMRPEPYTKSSNSRPTPSSIDSSLQMGPTNYLVDSSSQMGPAPYSMDSSSQMGPTPYSMDSSSQMGPTPYSMDSSSQMGPTPYSMDTSSQIGPAPYSMDSSSQMGPAPYSMDSSSQMGPAPYSMDSSLQMVPIPYSMDSSSQIVPTSYSMDSSSQMGPTPYSMDSSSQKRKQSYSHFTPSEEIGLKTSMIDQTIIGPTSSITQFSPTAFKMFLEPETNSIHTSVQNDNAPMTAEVEIQESTSLQSVLEPLYAESVFQVFRDESPTGAEHADMEREIIYKPFSSTPRLMLDQSSVEDYTEPDPFAPQPILPTPIQV